MEKCYHPFVMNVMALCFQDGTFSVLSLGRYLVAAWRVADVAFVRVDELFHRRLSMVFSLAVITDQFEEGFVPDFVLRVHPQHRDSDNIYRLCSWIATSPAGWAHWNDDRNVVICLDLSARQAEEILAELSSSMRVLIEHIAHKSLQR